MAALMLRLLAIVMLLLLSGCQHGSHTIALPERTLVIDPAELDLGDSDGSSSLRASLLIRNVSDQPVVIAKLSSSCGCTELRADSMALPAGGFTQLHVTIDPFGKDGDIVKRVTVSDPLGGESHATIRFHVSASPHAGVEQGRSLFDGSCAACHSMPAEGVHDGAEIYRAVCAMCHGSGGGGGYAPKLRGLDSATLKSIITHGAGKASMPPFAQQYGGPLSREQIRALVAWLR
ncbi:MAG: c-type cytochrome [Mariprofundales bacterium]|nr:c-type cytochrome [Mariprofundales bacterium]